jgi:hypothetical protein
MAYTIRHFGTSGRTFYAKPCSIVASPWDGDDIALTENGTTGEYTASIVSPANAYVIYEQIGGTPAPTDPMISVVDFTAELNADAIQAKTDLIGTNDADSPAAQTAQTNASTAATQAQAANAKLLGNVAAQTGDAFARLGAPAGASVSADIAGVKGDSGAIAAILSGITSLPKWLRAMFRKSTPDATALGEINSGGGSYDATTDSAEAMAEAIATVDATAGSAPTATEIWTHAQRSLTDGAIRVVSPFQSGSFAIVRGDSYLNADGNARSFGKVDGATWPTDLTGWTITFTCNPTDDLLETDSDAVGFTATGTVVTATGDSQAVRFDFTAAQTGALTPSVGGYKYDVQASKGNSRVTLETGALTVVEDQTTG